VPSLSPAAWDDPGLYTAAGYQPIESFGHYVDDPYSLCFARTLA